MSLLLLAFNNLEKGNLSGTLQALQQYCEKKSTRGLCRNACEKCRLEQARQMILAGKVSRPQGRLS